MSAEVPSATDIMNFVSDPDDLEFIEGIEETKESVLDSADESSLRRSERKTLHKLEDIKKQVRRQLGKLPRMNK